MKKIWKPIVAGVLDIISVVPVFLYWVLLLLVRLFTGEDSLGWGVGLAVYWPLFIALAVLGAIFSFQRKVWWFALASPMAIVPAGTFWNNESGVRIVFGLSSQFLENFFIIPPLAAAVLIALAREEFS
jgi:hypothetical protein